MADALCATYGARLLIATSASTAADPPFWRSKHDMANLLIDGRVGSAGFDGRRQYGLDHNGDEDQSDVQSSRRRDLRQRAQPARRQLRRERRERIEMKHDESFRKVDTG